MIQIKLLSQIIGFAYYRLRAKAQKVKTKKYIYEAKRNNIDILKPDINLSDKKYIIEEKGIRYPLTNIKNVGIAATELIISEREKGKYIDIYYFIRRCYGKSVTSKTLESLIYAGVFDKFGYNKKTLITNLDLIINYGELISDLDREFALEPEIINYEDQIKQTRICSFYSSS